MAQIKVKKVEVVEGRSDFATVIYSVPTEATPFNGYNSTRESIVMVHGQTAVKLIEKIQVEGWQHASGGRTNVSSYFPNTLIKFEGE